MELFYAPYPALETSFLRYVAEQRRSPLEPWLVVCASSVLANRLRTQLAREHGAVANIHFYTGSSLLYKLDEEAGPSLPVFPQDHLRDFLLKEILSEPDLNRYPISPGFIRALKDSLRDLADSLADPEILEEQIRSAIAQEGGLDEEQERFTWLVHVYRRYLQREAQLPGFRPYQALFQRAMDQVGKSPFLQGFTKIVFYGFYDMPGRLLEFVGQIRRFYRPVVFAPYSKHPAYHFAKKFFETNWLGTANLATDVSGGPAGALGACEPFVFAAQGDGEAPGVDIVSAADIPSEVSFVAKEILRLVEQEKYQFEDIGVLVRTQDLYQDAVRRIFAHHCIALNASFTHPLAKSPLGVFCFNLFLLESNGFDRESVLALLASPYLKNSSKQAWRMLAEKSAVSLHLSQWKDLLPQTPGFDPAFLAWLEQCNTQLTTLAAPGTWTQKSAEARAFLKENLEEELLQGKEKEIYQKICDGIDSLAAYSTIRTQARSGEFIRALTEALANISFHEVQTAPRGVVFTDVLHARGLSFKAVFLLGMNEKEFPQLQPEDPILTDRYRYLLRDVLGYWISQKAERVEEERLLFFAAASSASERLYISYAARGTGGKEQVPSVYVAEVARAARKKWNAEEKPRVGSLLSQRLGPRQNLFLTPQEVSCAIVLNGQNRVENHRLAGLFTPQVQTSLEAAEELARLGAPGAWDGFIQSGEAIFTAAQKDGFSPSALQNLAACPLKYFFEKALHLEETQDGYSREELQADERGSAYHAVLEDFYRELYRLGLTHQLFETGVAEYLDRALARHYTAQSYRIFGLYPLVWELVLQDIRDRLQAFVKQDIQLLGDYTPAYFEQEFSGVEIPGRGLRLRGIIDRIDVDRKHKTFRVIDYKSSRKGTKDLGKTFFTHLIFQPFLYVFAAQETTELKDFSYQASCLLSISPAYDSRELTAPAWQQMRPRAEQFLKLLTEIVKKGQFFLSPSELCMYCSYRSICRRDSFACLVRARKSAPSQKVEEVRYGA